MHCPKCKTRLNTTRTFDTQSKVEREKFCPKCKDKFTSIEILKNDYSEEIQTYEKKIKQLDDKYFKVKDKYSKLKAAQRYIIKVSYPAYKEQQNKKTGRKNMKHKASSIRKE